MTVTDLRDTVNAGSKLLAGRLPAQAQASLTSWSLLCSLSLMSGSQLLFLCIVVTSHFYPGRNSFFLRGYIVSRSRAGL